jgi:N-acylethanolamine-hydrolysing acid amidase
VESIVKDEIKSNIGDILGPALTSIGTGIMETATSLGRVYYGEELKAISARSGVKLGRLVILQLMYEAASCCTSIVVPGPDGVPRHIRTMDWGMDLLADLTIEIEFVKGGKTLYIATTWAGYVGILTGIKPSNFSVSVNFRVTGDSMWTNIKKAATACWPIGFLLREVFESAPDYDTAISWLSNSKLIAPCYFTVCGTKPGEGALLTRNRQGVEQLWELGKAGPIVQTNIDHWNNNDDDDILYSIDRRDRARTYVDSDPTYSQITESNLWRLMSKRPILNSLTVRHLYSPSYLSVS